MELRKQCAWSATRPELFYWRTVSGREVDVVLEDRAGRVVGVEVKAAATLGSNDVRGLQALASAVGKNWVRGVVLYTGAETIPFSAYLRERYANSILWMSVLGMILMSWDVTEKQTYRDGVMLYRSK
jgi:hypothetical protein